MRSQSGLDYQRILMNIKTAQADPLYGEPGRSLRWLNKQWDELYLLLDSQDHFVWWMDPQFKQAYMRMMDELIEDADFAMDNGCFPDDATDRELLQLSYHLPPVLALALLRKRLLRGVALRDLHRGMGSPVVDF